MKNIKRALKSIVLSSVICATLIMPVYAQDDSISISPIFTDEHGVWYPGRVDNNDFNISNNLNKSIKLQKMYVSLQSLTNNKTDQVITDDSKGYKEIIGNSDVTIRYGTKEVYNGSLEGLLNKDGIGLDNYGIIIGAKSDAKLNMAINMDGDSITNEAQDLRAEYNISLNYRDYNPGGGGDTNPPIEPPITPEPPVDPPVTPDPPPIEPPLTPEPEKPGTGEPSTPGSGNENNGSNVGGSTDKLPQTGGIINGTSLTILGVAVAGLGIALDRKSSDKGGKSDE